MASRFNFLYGRVGRSASPNGSRPDGSDERCQTIVMDWSRTPAGLVTDPRAIPHVPHRVCKQLDAEADRFLPHPVRMYVDYMRIFQTR
jgi:hypothetical protein